MNNYMIYLFEVSVCIAVFYLLYWTLLRRTTFFVLNRYYLVITMLVSFVIPLLEITNTGLPHQISEYVYEVKGSGPAVLDVHEEGVLLEQEVTYSAIEFYGMALYIAVAAFLGLRLLRNVVALLRKRRGRFEMLNGLRVIRINQSDPFSFFDTVFLPVGLQEQSILDHERIHIEQRHWIDLMVVELVMVVLWINPLLILVRRSIKLQHEYHADNGALGSAPSPEIYLSCLLAQISPARMPGPASQFFSNNLKNRIIMLTKKNSPRRMTLLYVLVVPAVVILLTAFSVSEDSGLAAPASGITLVVDAAHGGTDHGASSSGVAEKTITLAVAKQVQTLGEKLGVRVLLTRDDDRNMTLAERASFSNQNKADAFVSLHVDVDPSDSATNGISCLIASAEGGIENQRLSQNLADQFKRLNGISFRGTKSGNMYLLKNSTAPTVLIELGYLSNDDDLRFMQDADNQRKVAEQILKSVIAFKKK